MYAPPEREPSSFANSALAPAESPLTVPLPFDVVATVPADVSVALSGDLERRRWAGGEAERTRGEGEGDLRRQLRSEVKSRTAHRFRLLVVSSGPGPGESEGERAARRGGDGDLEGVGEAERGMESAVLDVCRL